MKILVTGSGLIGTNAIDASARRRRPGTQTNFDKVTNIVIPDWQMHLE